VKHDKSVCPLPHLTYPGAKILVIELVKHCKKCSQSQNFLQVFRNRPNNLTHLKLRKTCMDCVAPYVFLWIVSNELHSSVVLVLVFNLLLTPFLREPLINIMFFLRNLYWRFKVEKLLTLIGAQTLYVSCK